MMNNRQKNQILSVFLMIAAGIGTAALADHIHITIPANTIENIHGTTIATPSAATRSDADYEASPSDAEPEMKEAEERRNSAASLNMAFLMQPGPNGGEISAAEIILSQLSERDSSWFNNLYQVIDKTPKQLAAEIGAAPETVTGQYNPDDLEHRKEDPSTWTVNSWENINVSVCDGDGNSIHVYSNVKEILSLASVYSYYNGIDNIELFREYAGLLWEQSHSYTLGMSEVYYCDGCQEIIEEHRLGQSYEGTPEEERGIPEEILAVEGPGRDALIAQYKESLEAVESLSGREESEGWESAANSAADERTEVEQEETSADIILETGTMSSEAETKPSEVNPTFCPGHIDLHLTLTIKGIEEENGLFMIDPKITESLPADENGTTEEADSWKGWDLFNKVYAQYICRQDWETVYGLNISREAAIGIPLSGAEVRIYMNMMPEDTTKERRNVIKTALQSVGKIPYYWGGKPSNAGYEGNSFGLSVLPDEQGRILKGLDCSGWINWVYWTATGQQLAYQGTDGLAKSGRGISPEELKPGDIMVKLGENAHVVMFLAWSDTGEMIVIHESSDQNGGNVMISAKHPDWPYFRTLLD